MPHLGSTVHLRALAAAALSTRSAAAPRRTAPAERVVIVSASIGAGHDGAAHELHRRLRAAGVTVDRYDLLDLLPARIGRAVRDGYHRMLVRAPWVYQRVYNSTERAGGGGPLARALLRTAEDRMLRALPADTGAVVSTYPGASRVLGRLRLAGRLDVPVFTYLTDFSVHPLWVADGVDVHLAAHAVPAAQARALGAGDVRVGGPVVDPRFRPARAAERGAARARFGLPATAPLALLVAGSWGVGPVRQVALELRDCGAVVPVVVCGRNEALARELREDGIEHAYGWVDDMPGLMHAADVLVQNAGGLTSLEAFAAGLPVASYRCIPGHGPANAAALDEAGVAAWIQDAAELKDVLCDLIDGPRGLLQREAGLALFAAAGRGPADAIARACGARAPLPDPLAVAPSAAPGGGAGPSVAPSAVRGTGAHPDTAPSAVLGTRTRPALRRLAATAAAASTVWVCAVGTAVATTDTGKGVMHAIGRSLDLDDRPHSGTRHPEGHRS
ncbi:glycosyltransferase [Streptomyces guryensis]|uniref:Glycosyltransferase n=1 Tax=Streptomyces guryensis TaxID=2886947 RepID=A0A9Q3VSY3_9ACTN|nr:glycosyltransferase [Streptomyces guryensis]MCD9877891.1 glycosyltransferase [Streptomyces guryensis]